MGRSRGPGDRVAGVRAVRHPDGADGEADHERAQVGLEPGVAEIGDGDHEHQQERSADYLVDEWTDPPAVEVGAGKVAKIEKASSRWPG